MPDILTKKLVFLILATAVFLMPGTTLAAEKSAIGAAVVWPSEAGGWKRAGEPAVYEGRAIFDYMDGAGEVFLAYNFKRLAVQRYEKQGSAAIIAEFYEMATPQDAYGVFSWDRQDPDAGIGQGSESGGGLLRFWKGRHFVSVYGEGQGEEQEQVILEIGRGLASSIRDTGAPPLLLRALPDDRQVTGSVRFVRSHVLLNQRCFISNRNILELKADTEAVFARYDFGKERTFVLVIGYPAAPRAKSALAAFGKARKLNAAGMGMDGGAWTTARAEGRHVIIVLNAPKEDIAKRLLDRARININRLSGK